MNYNEAMERCVGDVIIIIVVFVVVITIVITIAGVLALDPSENLRRCWPSTLAHVVGVVGSSEGRSFRLLVVVPWGRSPVEVTPRAQEEQ